MPTAYVIHAESDRSFLEKNALRFLPSHGYEHWIGRAHASGGAADAKRAMRSCQVILVILSPATVESAEAGEDIEAALASGRPLIAVKTADLDNQAWSRLPERLRAAPRVDFTAKDDEFTTGMQDAVHELIAQLPPLEDKGGDATFPAGAQRIEWNEEIFSAALTVATKRHDDASAAALIGTIAAHLSYRPYPYPPKAACDDLNALRQEREFELMVRYGEAVLKSGTKQDKVRRLFAQGLIETRRYDRALDVLQSMIDDATTSATEVFEAKGLIGRTYKQRYVEADGAPGSADLIVKAIAAYEGVYEQDRTKFWHGVNAASCILRAKRDGIDVTNADRAHKIAAQIVDDVAVLEQQLRQGNSRLNVWDCASRIEALVDLDRYDNAQTALDAYLAHPDMQAFEVSSTFRQFDQVLELDEIAPARSILARLREAVERYRAGKAAPRSRDTADLSAESVAGPARLRPLVIRVDDTQWQPNNVTDLVIQTRYGKIVTARGSDAAVRELMSDLHVVAVDESRPAGSFECDKSVKFIRVSAEYASVAGSYAESGDRALIAIIDNGTDVLHEAFLDANGKSRILGIWDQNGTTGAPPPGFTYGTFHDDAAIASYIQAGVVPAALGRNPSGHGTHVASIAGGRAAGFFAGGVAPDAKLLVVISGGSGPIGYSQSHVEALAFIDAFATARNLPVVVNLSQGMNAGAHDGKSSLEVAFDAFTESGRKRGRVVVKSAGNERTKNGHAKITMAPNSRELLTWKRNQRADAIEQLELWWNSADEFEFRLRDPSQNWSPWVGHANPNASGTLPGGSFRLIFTKLHRDNGDNQLVVELGSETSAAAIGEWQVEIRSSAVPEGGEMHAWIERTPGAPSAFVNHQSEEMTLSIPGTAASVIAVGAVEAGEFITVGAFSSYGPTRDGQKKPLVCAPGVGINAANGGTSNGARSDSGTSMAAPHVTGAIALLLSRKAKTGLLPSSSQIASALRKTRNYNGRWDRGQGYGVVDASALLAAFDP